jgi:hypothetical protein
VNTTVCVAAILGSVLLTSCATTAARLHGISATDIAEINRVVHAVTAQEILSYYKFSDTSIGVDVRDQKYGRRSYVVERVKGQWKIDQKAVIVES